MIAQLAEHFHWPHDYWRRMGWREFRAWLRERNRSVERRAEGQMASADSWAGRENDPWWAEQDRKRDELRGR